MRVYDLHSHSTASDGLLTPTELVNRAVEKGINVLALTDHDTVAGIAEAKLAASQCGIHLISGLEISVLWEEKTIHLTALNIDEKNSVLTQLLQQQAEIRLQRAIEIGDKLAKIGVTDAYLEAKKLANGEVTRAHYARLLIAKNKVKTQEQAFKRYLSQGKSCYVKASWCSIQQAIDVVHQAGGVICVAHPLRYKLTARWIRTLLHQFKQMGGDGMEVSGCGQTPEQRQLLVRWATDFELFASVGSDFHFPTGWIDLGKELHLPANCQPIWQLFSMKE